MSVCHQLAAVFEMKDDGLRALALSAPNPLMRELALLALAQEQSLGTLAEQLNSQPGLQGSRDASNVRRLFETKKPSPAIVEGLVQIIGMETKHRRAAELRLRPAEVNEALTSALEELDDQAAHFVAGAVADVKRAIAKMSGDSRTRAAAAYVLGQCHAKADIEDPRLIEGHFDVLCKLGEPLTAFLLALHPEFDVERSLVTGSRTVDSLFHLYSMMRNWGLTRSEAETVVSVVEPFLVAHGTTQAEVARMRDFLKHNHDRADAGAEALVRFRKGETESNDGD